MASLPCPACGVVVEPDAGAEVLPDACRSCGQPLRIDYRYRLTEFLGGSADRSNAVYRAVSEPLGTAAAVLVCAAGGQARDTFVDGYQRFSRLRHRSIASIRSIDEGNGAIRRPATVVIEWLAGGLLRHRVEQGGRLGAPEVGELLHGLLGGLNLASTSLPPIAHGAISPDTIGFRGEGPVPVLFAFERGHAIAHASTDANTGLGSSTGPHVDVLEDLAAVGRVAAWAATQNEWADPATLTEALDARLATIIDGLRKAPQRQGYRSASAAMGDLQAHVHPPMAGGATHRPAHTLTHDEGAGFDPFARATTTATRSASAEATRQARDPRARGKTGAQLVTPPAAVQADLVAELQRRAAQSSQSATQTPATSAGGRRHSGAQRMPVEAPKPAADGARVVRRLFIGGIVLFFLAPVCVEIAEELAEEIDAPQEDVARLEPTSVPAEQSVVDSTVAPTADPFAPTPEVAPMAEAAPEVAAAVHEAPPFVPLPEDDPSFPLLKRASGKVSKIEGTIPHGLALGVGDRCTVEVRMPTNSETFPCRVFAACGEPLHTYYGAGTAGYMTCEMENGKPLRATDDADDDGDPAFTFDLPAGTAKVSATRPEPWAVEIKLTKR